MSDSKFYLTTPTGRFVDALRALMGVAPPLHFVTEWLEAPLVEGRWNLKDWVIAHTPSPITWATPEVLIDAALIIAQNPNEEALHQPWPGRDDADTDALPVAEEAISAALASQAHGVGGAFPCLGDLLDLPSASVTRNVVRSALEAGLRVAKMG